jgi:hypothetical protein
MRGSLCLDLRQYGDKESRAIAELGARRDDLGSAFAFICRRRSLAEFRQYLKADKALRRMLKPKRWASPY